MKYEDPLINEEIHGNANVSQEPPAKTFIKLLAALSILVVVGYLLLSTFIYQIVKFIPFESEKRWFTPLTQSVLEKFSQEETEIAQRKKAELQRIADKLVNATLAKDPKHPLSNITINIHYSNDEMINAFAMPGGEIVVMRGLVEALEDENALAMVIAHEIAHVIHRDSLKSIGRGVLVNILVSSLFGGDSTGLMNRGITLMSVKHSRSDEAHADSTGLELLYDAYGNAYGATQLFYTFAKVNPRQNRWVTLSDTHPLPLDRRDNMEEKIAKNKYAVDKSTAKPMPLVLSTLAKEP